MPFKSKAQRRLFYSKMQSGEMTPETVKHWEEATPKNKKLPEHVTKKANAFIDGFAKIALFQQAMQAIKKVKPETWDKAGLGALAIAPAYHGYKAIKDKSSGEAALAGSELGGLGMLYHAVRKAHA